MIIVSSRKDFDDPDHISKAGHTAKEIELSTNTEKSFDISKLPAKINNKKVLILVHGYNNEQHEVYDAYQIIEQKIKAHAPGMYDFVIGYSWPGGDRGLEWWQGKSRANSVARIFRFLVEEMSNSAKAVDIMSHSLGARVTLKALKESQQQDVVRNYYCTAPAVDNECLEQDEEFYAAVSSCGRLFVFHSSRDGVLRISYEAAEWDRALGLYGPEDKDYVSTKAKKIYVANCKKHVSNHGGYKRADKMYMYIQDYQAKNPAKFKTL
jgi:esterase/lipase superfamily enzyme